MCTEQSNVKDFNGVTCVLFVCVSNCVRVACIGDRIANRQTQPNDE